MKLIWLLPIVFSSFVHAKSACQLLEDAKQSIAVHAANWVNATATRTPEGGPYKVKRLECQGDCKVVESNQVVTKYEPNHPDADKDGYVHYPAIDKAKEYISISAYAQILRRIHNECPEKAQIADGKTSTLISYKTGPIKLDIFNFKDDWNLSSWTRESTTGESKNINF